MDRDHRVYPNDENEARLSDTDVHPTRKRAAEPPAEDDANPPRTTTGNVTSPKFGSAGSGGAELEPGPGPGKN